jgi:hypothetical protein
MKKRKNEEVNEILFNKKEFKLFIALKNKISDYVELLNYHYETNKIPYTVMVIFATEESMKETLSNIRKTDIFLNIPHLRNHYLLFFQNTDCKEAIEVGSRLTSLIERTFMINKKNISHKVAVISFEEKPPSLLNLCHEIILVTKKFKQENSNDFWVEIKRF